MNIAELTESRKQSVKNLAIHLGYTVDESKSSMDIISGGKKIFAYTPLTNTFFTYKNRYSKQLNENGYIGYINVCLQNTLPAKHSAPIKSSIRYVVDKRGSSYAIYDTMGGHKVESFLEYGKAINSANRLNDQWLIEVNSTKRY